MAKNTYTSVEYWAGMRISEFAEWVKANNELVAEENERIKGRR